MRPSSALDLPYVALTRPDRDELKPCSRMQGAVGADVGPVVLTVDEALSRLSGYANSCGSYVTPLRHTTPDVVLNKVMPSHSVEIDPLLLMNTCFSRGSW
jgi:hypothetical protein